MNLLTQEINRWIGLPFIWGENDCCLLLSDWVARARGLDYDPAENYRYCYDSRASCHRLTGFLRDPVRPVASVFEDIVGLKRTTKPKRGDVGVVIARDQNGRESPVGSIFTGKSWITKAPHGMTSYQPLRVLAAWSVEYEDQ